MPLKKLSQEFKVKRTEVVHQVVKQKEQVKTLQSNIKQLKQQVWHAQLPLWEKQIAVIDTIPFLFVALDNMHTNELREIAHLLLQKKPGFYFLISTTDSRSLFYSTIAPEFEKKINLQNFAGWLKDKFSLHGGSQRNNILQGGGGKFNADLKEAIKTWISNQ